MESRPNPPRVSLSPVSRENWRDVAALEVAEGQSDFVAPPSYYLCLCHFDGLWNPLAVVEGSAVVGFLMWAEDDDGSCWLGGILIDRRQQGRGLGTAAVAEAIRVLADDRGFRRFALSYSPENRRARRLYATLGFRETGETEGDEIVARRDGSESEP